METLVKTNLTKTKILSQANFHKLEENKKGQMFLLNRFISLEYQKLIILNLSLFFETKTCMYAH